MSDAVEGNTDIAIELWRAGDTKAYAIKTATVNSGNNSAQVVFAVRDLGSYYIKYGSVKSDDSVTVTPSATVSSNTKWSDGSTAVYNFEKVAGKYVVSENDRFAVEKVVTVFEKEYEGDYSVVYLDSSYNLIAAADAVNSQIGGYPKATSGNYKIAVVKGDLTGENLEAIGNLSGLSFYYDDIEVQDFTIKAATKSLEGAAAYDFDNDGDKDEIADKSFVYDGNDITVGFEVDGEALKGSDFTAVVKSAPAGASIGSINVTGGSNAGKIEITSSDSELVAGDYVVTLYGNGTTYSGQVDVKFTVEKLDLSEAVAKVPAVKGLDATLNANFDDTSIYGKFAAGEVTLTNELADVKKNTFTAPGSTPVAGFTLYSGSGFTNCLSADGTYTWVISAKADNPNVTGSTIGTVERFADVATFSYGNKLEPQTDSKVVFNTFYTELGQAFNPNNLTMTVGGQTTRDGFSYKVYDLEGNEVTSWSEVGTYKLVVTCDPDATFAKGGSVTCFFKVAANDVDPAIDYKAYAAIDGKMLSSVKGTPTAIDYKAAAYAYDLIVKDGDKTVSADEYTVSLADEKGNAVESIEGVGEYVITVKFNGFDESKDKKFYVEVEKAEIVSAAAVADFYAIGVEPTFYGYTKDGLKGQKFALASDDIDVVYRDADGNKVKFEDIDEAGTYTAEINVLSTCETLATTKAVTAEFEVKEVAGFSDVAADAWYADEVYAAKELQYMNGIAGTKLFMPESQITRAEVAQVFFNMAGQSDEEGKFPTQFSDVDAEAWYAQAIAWASQAGIVGGYEGTDVFGTFDNATREQIATMIYRYAKAQGMDVAVEDEAKALSAYADADQLTYGKTAMAWCVEQGIFGVDVDSLRPADNMSRAEMAATAIRVQPEALV